MLTIKGEAGKTEKAALVCDMIILAVFLWDQIRYGLNMLFLIIPLAAIGLYLALFCVVPEEYCFSEDSLRIQHRFRKPVSIPYASVFNYEASAKDSFINIGRSNKVKLYYELRGKKRAALCRPRDVETFVETLIKKCPEFREEPGGKSSIEVFFDKND